MADKLMYIPNDDTPNYPFFRLQLVVETFGHSKFNKIPKVVKPANKDFIIKLWRLV